MTGSSWGIERPQLKQQDVAPLSVPFLDDHEMTSGLAELAAAASPDDSETTVAMIDQYLVDCFQLERDELALIEDRLQVQLPAYNQPLAIAAYGTPTRREIERYRSTLQRTLRASLSSKTVVHAAPLDAEIVVTIGFAGASPTPRASVDHLGWLAAPSETLLIRRPQRTYGRDWCELRKLGERKEVTTAAALHDADEIVSELLRAASRVPDPIGPRE